VDRYLPKPVRSEELFAAIDGLVQVPPGPMASQFPDTQWAYVIDRQQVLARFEGDQALLANLISAFFSHCPDLMAALRDTSARQDKVEFQHLIRLLRGHLELLSARAACEALESAETVGCTQDRELADEALARLDEEIERLCPALSNLGRELTL